MMLITSAVLFLLSGEALARDLAPDSMTIRELLARGGSVRITRPVTIEPAQKSPDHYDRMVIYQADREAHIFDSSAKRGGVLNPKLMACYVNYFTSRRNSAAESFPGYRLHVDANYTLPILNDGVASDVRFTPSGRAFTLALRPVRRARSGGWLIDSEPPFRSISCLAARDESREDAAREPTVGDFRRATQGLFELELGESIERAQGAQESAPKRGYETIYETEKIRGVKIRVLYNAQFNNLRVFRDDTEEAVRGNVSRKGDDLERALEPLLRKQKRDREELAVVAGQIRARAAQRMSEYYASYVLSVYGIGQELVDPGYRYEKP